MIIITCILPLYPLNLFGIADANEMHCEGQIFSPGRKAQRIAFHFVHYYASLLT